MYIAGGYRENIAALWFQENLIKIGFHFYVLLDILYLFSTTGIKMFKVNIVYVCGRVA